MNKVIEKAIGIFDSGLGGLTVVSEIIKQLPYEDLIYFADGARFPYGPRELEEVKGFVFEIIDFLKTKDVKFIVIACNTATAAGLPDAQDYYDIPIIGVIDPGAKGAVEATKNRKIGVIATQATIKSNSYVKAIQNYDSSVQVFTCACPPFVDFVERGETRGENVTRVVYSYLKPLIDAQVDTLILGCTHYPLLEKVVGEVMGSDVFLISSAKETAREIEAVLSHTECLRGARHPKYRFLTSGDEDKFRKFGSRFLGREIESVEKVDLRRLVELPLE